MKLSIIIPTHNRKNVLLQTLKEFCEQTYKDFEIIIVDDGSNDGTRQVVTELKLPLEIKYFFQKNKGPAAARNLGTKQAMGEIIFFTGDDIIPSKELIEEHINSHKNRKENVVVLGYTTWSPKIRKTPFRKYISEKHFAYSDIIDNENVFWGSFYTSNISIKKSFLERTQLFDEDFKHAAYEDSEIGYRLFKLGMQTVFNQAAIAYHNHNLSFRNYEKTMFYKGKSAVLLSEKVPALKEKANFKESNTFFRHVFKKLIFNKFSLAIITQVICFLDGLCIPLPESIYRKILGYYYVQGIKNGK
jgi:glycosyltransferase involved in cell wall biosynthesis